MPAGTGPLRLLFDVWSRFYDVALVQRVLYRPVQDAVVAELGRARPAPQRVLDVGCGTGILAARLVQAFGGTAVVGCDLSAGMLEQAARRSDAVRWVRADAQHLPFAGGTFDALCCTESFHWYPDQSQALREFARVLAAGGTLLLALLNPLLSLPRRITGQSMPSQATLRALIEAADMDVLDQRRVRHPVTQTLVPNVLTIARR